MTQIFSCLIEERKILRKADVYCQAKIPLPGTFTLQHSSGCRKVHMSHQGSMSPCSLALRLQQVLMFLCRCCPLPAFQTQGLRMKNSECRIRRNRLHPKDDDHLFSDRFPGFLPGFFFGLALFRSFSFMKTDISTLNRFRKETSVLASKGAVS